MLYLQPPSFEERICMVCVLDLSIDQLLCKIYQSGCVNSAAWNHCQQTDSATVYDKIVIDNELWEE